MYLPAIYAEPRLSVLHQFIRDNPLGVITTNLASSKYPSLQSSHIPWVLDIPEDRSDTDLGILRGHMTRINPQSRAMVDVIKAQGEPQDGSPGELPDEVLILFNGPSHYVTPKFYTQTTLDNTGNMAPTWNYSTVQVYGKASVYIDPGSEQTQRFLTKQLGDLAQQSEVGIMGHSGTNGAPPPWKISDAPPKFINTLKLAIIGVEVRITRIEGKFKMSQELVEGDREGVVSGFEALSTDAALTMARTVRERNGMKVYKL